MPKNLVIVESPAKAKTIEKFLGSDYTVTSSFGHIRDLADGDLSVDVKRNFAPLYEVPEDKKKVVAELKKLAKGADAVWLATDEDREGEAISWHLAQVLGLDVNVTKRIVFHEITKPAILKAIETPRTIDLDLVNAQQARRVLDRLVGFEVSPILWKKVQPSLSAGRVQSVAVRLVVEREREIFAFQVSSNFKVSGTFMATKEDGKYYHPPVKAEVTHRFPQKGDARSFLEQCGGQPGPDVKYFVKSVTVKPGTRSPSAPFTTSTLQQEASRKLGMSVIRTMSLAQKLYEAGHITYMRTDSVNLAGSAINDIKDAIIKNYGSDYSQVRKFTNKNESAQEAHEAIRPTYVERRDAGGDEGEQKLYDLIWKRTVASQMANAKLERTIVEIERKFSKEPNPLQAYPFVATGEVLLFDGFLKLYLEGKDDEDDDDLQSILPPLKAGQEMIPTTIEAIEKFTRPLPRYTEASLVKKLEELGIGRPSTFAPTITTVQKRGYVQKTETEGLKRSFETLTLVGNDIKEGSGSELIGKDKGKLAPSSIGMLVNDFLLGNFPEILDYSFTANVEKEFDLIAEGKRVWQEMMSDFYIPFHEQVLRTTQEGERVKSDRRLGIDPSSGKPVIARLGRFGPHVQIGETADEEKPRYARLKKDQLIETITMEDAMDLFKLPRSLGEFEDSEVKSNVGRFGPFLAHKGEFYSLGKDDDPYTVTIERAHEIIVTKREEKANRLIREVALPDGTAQLLNGRWGPYLAFNKGNFKLPKGTDPLLITIDELVTIIESAPAPAKGGRFGKKTTASKGEAPTKEDAKAVKPKRVIASSKTSSATKAKTTAVAKKKATPVKKKA